MGLTLIQRSSGHPPPRNPKIALVLAGGAVSGGAFKVGGLKALDKGSASQAQQEIVDLTERIRTATGHLIAADALLE